MSSDRAEIFRKALEQDPDNELAHFSLANELCADQLYEEALLHYEACVKVNPSWMRVHIQIGKCCLELGNPERAVASLLKARELMTQKGDFQNLEEVNSLLAHFATDGSHPDKENKQ
jgi:tetratricopeptide (TPR) repeat protein